MVRQFNDDDEGMTVRTADGDEVGTIQSTDHDEAAVKPAAGLSDSIRSRLDWGEKDEETYTLQHSDVESITDDAVLVED